VRLRVRAVQSALRIVQTHLSSRRAMFPMIAPGCVQQRYLRVSPSLQGAAP